MPVTFQTPSYASITMLDDVAATMLRMLGLSGTVPSAIRAEDIPDALEKLRSALKQASTPDTGNSTSEDDDAVSLDTRALPLIELLESAAANNHAVMWE